MRKIILAALILLFVLANPVNSQYPLTKEGPDTCVVPGDTFNYTICFNNTFSSEPIDVNITDELPTEIKYLSATPINISGELKWELGSIDLGEEICIELKVKVKDTATGTLKNEAYIEGEPISANHTTNICQAYVVSSDSAGEEKNLFRLDENVSCYAGNLPSNKNVDIYIVPNRETDWEIGESIGSDVSDGINTVTTESNGDIENMIIWNRPLDPGKYDIIVDVNQDGYLNASEPVDDVSADEGFEAIPEFSNIAIPVIGLLAIVLIMNRRT